MAPRSVANLLARVRQVLQDEDQENYRYPTSDLVGYYNDAMFETQRLRPDLFIGKWDAIPQVDEASDTDYSVVDFALSPIYFLAVVDFVAGRTELRDDEFAVDGRAMTLMNSLSQKLMGGA
jgi:hypothetical protein